MISKELLSEVLSDNNEWKDCDSFNIVEMIEPNVLISYCEPFYDNYGTDGVCDCSMKKVEYWFNIYELAYKCKEWAFKNGFGLTSGLLNYSKTKIAVLENIDLLMPKISFVDNTEAEAIFKACEWILDNKGIK